MATLPMASATDLQQLLFREPAWRIDADPHLVQRARRTLQSLYAPKTIENYLRIVREYLAWCSERAISPPIPASAGALLEYLEWAASQRRFRSVEARLVVLNRLFRQAGYARPSSLLEIAQWRLAKKRASGPPLRKRALSTSMVRAMAGKARQTLPALQGLRDVAVILFGYSGAMRRSEIARLVVADLESYGGNLLVRIPRSKGDQQAEGQVATVVRGLHRQTCPLLALQQWLDAAHITQGPVFRPFGPTGALLAKPVHPETIARIVKRYAAEIGLDPREVGAHSMRAGYATTAIAAGASIVDVSRQLRHRHYRTTEQYIRETPAMLVNMTSRIGL